MAAVVSWIFFVSECGGGEILVTRGEEGILRKTREGK